LHFILPTFMETLLARDVSSVLFFRSTGVRTKPALD
jgi:hypothetical protein